MGLRDWTENKLNGSTSDETIGKGAKALVECAQSIVSVSPWIGGIVLIGALSGSTIGLIQFPLSGSPVGQGKNQVTVAAVGILALLWGYRIYENQIHCDYP